MAKKILYGVLDWGLGHATRSVPIIKYLLTQGCEVRLASSGSAHELLSLEFPDLTICRLPAYQVRYSRHGLFMLTIFWQVPRLLVTILREAKAARRLAREFPADLVISDCRYGFRLPGRRSAFITHQLQFQMPRALRFLQPCVNAANRAMINRFDEVWIPDEPDGITGNLSNPEKMITKVRWVGILTRLPRLMPAAAPGFEVAAILSGPEPQRSLLETKLVAQLQRLRLRAVVVRGLPAAPAFRHAEGIDFYNYLSGEALAKVIQQARVVVARSGYSTVMDLMGTGCHAFFVPTPGQTEQELLADRLKELQIAGSMPQRKFDLEAALAGVDRFRGFAGWNPQPNLLPGIIDEFLQAPDCD